MGGTTTCQQGHFLSRNAKLVELTVDLVDCTETGDAGAVDPQFAVPIGQVLVGVFPGGVKDQDAGVGLVVVGRVHRLELLLAGGVPKIFEQWPT